MWLCTGRLKSWLVHEASSTLVPLCQRCLPAQTHIKRFVNSSWKQQCSTCRMQSHWHSLRPCLRSEFLVLPEVSPQSFKTNALSLSEKCKHVTHPLFITAWGFVANQQRKKAQNSFQAHTSQCKWKTHQRADALKCWYGTMITTLCSFFLFPDWKAVVLEKSLLVSLLKNSWFCSVFILNTQC